MEAVDGQRPRTAKDARPRGPRRDAALRTVPPGARTRKGDGVRIYVYVPLLVAAVLAALAPRLALRLVPRYAAWALVCVALVTAAGWLGSLSLLAFTALAQIPAVAQEGRWSIPLLRAEDPVDFAVAVVCMLALATSALGLATAFVRQARDFVWARRESRLLPGGSGVALVDDEVPQAFALAGKPARIVVSRGMVRCLDEREYAAMLAHEHAHLRNRHHLFKAVWRLAAAANPLLRPVAAAGGYLLERWADEDAATRTGDRTLVARAVARAALAATEAARSGPGALSATGGAVPQRVKSLLVPAPRKRLLPFVVGALLLAVCSGSLLAAASDSEQMVDLAQRPVCAAAGHPHAETPARRSVDPRHVVARCDLHPHHASTDGRLIALPRIRIGAGKPVARPRRSGPAGRL